MYKIISLPIIYMIYTSRDVSQCRASEELETMNQTLHRQKGWASLNLWSLEFRASAEENTGQEHKTNNNLSLT